MFAKAEVGLVDGELHRKRNTIQKFSYKKIFDYHFL
jgi:hypothetical protein